MLLLRFRLFMVTLWSWMVQHKRSMGIQLLRAARAPGQPYVSVGNPACPYLQVFACQGLLGSAIVCARFARLDP